nr:hypothetical protein Itr_chr12CG20090 [Ipomoea trifida]
MPSRILPRLPENSSTIAIGVKNYYSSGNARARRGRGDKKIRADLCPTENSSQLKPADLLYHGRTRSEEVVVVDSIRIELGDAAENYTLGIMRLSVREL